MRNVSQSVCLRCLPVPDPFDGALFCTFQPVSELVIWSFISKSDFKTCKLDWLLPLFLWNTLILSFLLSLLSSTLPCPLAPFLTVLKLPLLHLFKNTPKNPTLLIGIKWKTTALSLTYCLPPMSLRNWLFLGYLNISLKTISTVTFSPPIAVDTATKLHFWK